jgi:hypothetical protein
MTGRGFGVLCYLSLAPSLLFAATQAPCQLDAQKILKDSYSGTGVGSTCVHERRVSITVTKGITGVHGLPGRPDPAY